MEERIRGEDENGGADDENEEGRGQSAGRR